MVEQHPRKKLIIFLIFGISFIALGIVWRIHSIEQLSFNSSQWKSTMINRRDRYDLATTLVQESLRDRWSRETVVEKAGLPEGAFAGFLLQNYHKFRYDGGDEPGFIGRPKTVVLYFGKDGKVVEARLVDQ